MIETIHRAKYVLAETGLLVHNGAVRVSDSGRVSGVEPWRGAGAQPGARVADWGSALILPGLINCHTHLELTRLHNQLKRFSSFTDWLSQLIVKRRGWSRQDYLDSAREGARMSLSFGTTLVGDISGSGLSRPGLRSEKLRKVIFEETLGLQPQKAPEALALLETRLKHDDEDDLTVSGVSPHATYSVSSDLYRAVARLAHGKGIPLATHVAESEEEVKFLHSGTGELRDFLEHLGILPGDWKPPGLSPVSYLDKLGVLERPSLLIHCNYLDAESVSRILASRSSVIYCPRSHAFFGHEKHPVRQLMDMGVNVALGTDSLASNDSLSMLEEMRFLSRTRKDVRCDEIFRMATLNGAAALNFGATLGSLKHGCRADMTILRVPAELTERNLTAQILEGAGDCIATIIGGETAWSEL